MHGSVEQRYSRPCTTAYDQEDLYWRMMVKVVPYRRWDTITLVHYWKFLLGRAPSVFSNIKRRPSKGLIGGGLRINLVAVPKNVQVLKI